MKPSINDGDWLIIQKFSNKMKINKEDIIIFYKQDEIFIKRVASISSKAGISQYFVMGDNKVDSLDSRNFGTVNNDEIIGKPVFRYWPINAIKKIWFK